MGIILIQNFTKPKTLELQNFRIPEFRPGGVPRAHVARSPTRAPARTCAPGRMGGAKHVPSSLGAMHEFGGV